VRDGERSALFDTLQAMMQLLVELRTSERKYPYCNDVSRWA
jgi:hypothetical protein